MKLIDSEGNQFVFHFDLREKRLLHDLLSLYPLIPASHHRLTKSGDPAAHGDQQLLEEALAEQRQENKRQVDAMLNEKGRFRRRKTGFDLALSADELEWLLQVLNDVRVGSWVLLGEPDEMHGKDVILTEQNARYFWSMELSGMFQAAFLQALQG